jgi:hypothetical protein
MDLKWNAWLFLKIQLNLDEKFGNVPLKIRDLRMKLIVPPIYWWV